MSGTQGLPRVNCVGMQGGKTYNTTMKQAGSLQLDSSRWLTAFVRRPQGNPEDQRKVFSVWRMAHVWSYQQTIWIRRCTRNCVRDRHVLCSPDAGAAP